MGTSIAQARNRGGITASNAQVEILLAINREIHSSLSVNSLLQLLVEKAVVGVGFERGLIYLIEGDFLRCRAFLDRVKKEKASVILKRVGFRMEEQAIETLAVRLGRSFHIRDARNDSRVSKKLLRVADVSEYCVVPITGRREVLGVFTGDKYYSKAPILPEELKFLELFAGQVGLALENAKLYEEKDCLNEILRQRVSERTEELCRANRMLENKIARLEVLLATSRFLEESLKIEEMLSKILLMIPRLGHSMCAAYVMDKGGSPHIQSVGLNPEHDRMMGLPFSEELAKVLVQAEQPVKITDMISRLREGPFKEFCRRHSVNSCVVLPLVPKSRLAAMVIIYLPEGGSLEENEMEYFACFARHCTVALEKTLAIEELMLQKREAEFASAKLRMENLYLKERTQGGIGQTLVVGQSLAMRAVMEQVRQVAPTQATVILYGETGTGKELIAKAIHAASPRREGPLVTVNCPAIPEQLFESELFGHERGAFTGALTRRIGLFEVADKGTIFLDEIGDIPMEIQKKLLRVLQEQEIQPLGSRTSKKIDVRVVAATNRDLQELVRENRFRSDLYYRLNVFPIKVPPLRERREDIPELVKFFLQRYQYLNKEVISVRPEVLEVFQNYDWPGNVRELENLIERLLIVCKGPEITLRDVPVEFWKLWHGKPIRPWRDALSEFKKEMLLRALSQAQGKRVQAARLLGMAPPNFCRLAKRLGVLGDEPRNSQR